MKANIGDFINPPDQDGAGRIIYNPKRVIAIEDDNSYLLENGQVIADSEITADDVLLESEVF